jgi:hypothetical protein
VQGGEYSAVSPRLGAGLWFVFAIHLLLIAGFLIYCVECSFRLGFGVWHRSLLTKRTRRAPYASVGSSLLVWFDAGRF